MIRVTNVSGLATDEIIRTLFSHIGIVESVDLFKVAKSGEAIQEAVVKFSRLEDASLALQLTGTPLVNRKLMIQLTQNSAVAHEGEPVDLPKEMLEDFDLSGKASPEGSHQKPLMERTTISDGSHRARDRSPEGPYRRRRDRSRSRERLDYDKYYGRARQHRPRSRERDDDMRRYRRY